MRIKERSDNRTLGSIGKQGLETLCTHSVNQCTVVLFITFVTGGNTSFFVQLFHSLVKGTDYMCGRRETPFTSTLLHRFPLVIDIQ